LLGASESVAKNHRTTSFVLHLDVHDRLAVIFLVFTDHIDEYIIVGDFLVFAVQLVASDY